MKGNLKNPADMLLTAAALADAQTKIKAAGEECIDVRAGETKNAGDTDQIFNKGSKIPDDVFKTKPKYSRNPDQWLESGGKITIKDGVWEYTDPEGISVKYINGYPDFKGSGHVKQKVNIGPIRNSGCGL